MACFSNGTEGMVFDEQCNRCRYGQHSCPIAYVQMNWNYTQDKDARDILDHLVKDDGTCTMYKMDEANFFKDPNQESLL